MLNDVRLEIKGLVQKTDRLADIPQGFASDGRARSANARERSSKGGAS
jgi:hypothetical protein